MAHGEFQVNDKKYPIWINQRGYPCITVTQEDGTERAFLLHRVVWEAANGPPPPNYDIHHKDMNKENWSLDNLSAVDRETHREIHRQARSTSKNNKSGMKRESKSNPNHPRTQP
jgi:hypothetical protein